MYFYLCFYICKNIVGYFLCTKKDISDSANWIINNWTKRNHVSLPPLSDEFHQRDRLDIIGFWIGLSQPTNNLLLIKYSHSIASCQRRTLHSGVSSYVADMTSQQNSMLASPTIKDDSTLGSCGSLWTFPWFFLGW